MLVLGRKLKIDFLRPLKVIEEQCYTRVSNALSTTYGMRKINCHGGGGLQKSFNFILLIFVIPYIIFSHTLSRMKRCSN